MYSLKTLLNKYFKESGLESGLLINKLRKQWPDIVGKTIAVHTSPESVKGNELTIAVDTPQWMHHLGFFKQEISSKLAPFNLKNIRFRLGRPPKRTVRETPVDAARLSDENISYIEDTLKNISDPALKETFRKFLSHGLTRGKKL